MIRIGTNNDGSGSRRPKNLLIRIHKYWFKNNTVYFRLILTFLVVDGMIRIGTNNDGSGSRRPKNLLIRIRNTGLRTTLYSSDFTQKTSCVFVTQSLDDILEPVLSTSTSAAQPLLFTPQRRQRNSGRTSRNSTPTREAYNLR
jgi:hypothetical protein